MKDKTRIILALTLVFIALFGEKVLDLIKNNVEIVTESTSNIDEPSMENKDLVKPISELNIEKQDSELISLFYLELADVIDKDDTIISSTGQFRNLNIYAGLLHFNTTLRDKYKNLGESIDSAIVNAIGKSDVVMDEEKRQDLVDIINAIAWSATQ